jgi:type I restriction enzyme S subunit
MSFKEIQLGDAIHIKHGFAFKGQHFVDEGELIVLTPGNFHEEGGFRVRLGKDRAYAGDVPDGYILNQGDLIVAMTEQGPGLLGSSALVPESNRYLHNQRLGLIDSIDDNLLDREFLYYLFNTAQIRGQISGSATGTKVRHTAPERIYRVRACVPNVARQKAIAQTLRNYDELILNNQRRIELLEQSARLLFREWFARLRYPGHEHAKVVDGVPKGWKRTLLGDIAITNSSSFSARSLLPEINYIDISSVQSGRVLQKTRMNAEDAPGRARRRIRDGDVIWSNVRPNLRQFALIADPDEADVVSTGFTTLSPKTVPSSFLYLAVTTDAFVAHLVNHTTGASYPAVRPEDFERAELLVPTAALLEDFHSQCEPMFRLAHRLEKQNRKLAQARDLLLPRLMDGRTSV